MSFGSGGAEYELATRVTSDGFGGLESKLGSAGGALSSFKKSVGLAGGALAALSAGALAKATQSAIEFESQLADLEKVTSSDLVGPLKEGIMDLSERIPMARKGLVELATQAGKFGAESEEEILAFTESVGKIASATSLAADEAGTRFAKIAGAIGMPMAEIDKLGNAVNSLADSMKTDAGEITDTATRASNILSQQLGIGQDTVLALSASMNEVSSSSRLAASSLRRMAETMMDPRKMGDMAAAIDMTKDEFKAMVKTEPEKLMNRLAQAMKENGRGADILRSTIGKAANDFNKLASQTDQTAKAQNVVNQQFKEGTSLNREMAIRTSTAAGKWQLLTNKVQNAASRIGDRLLPHVKDLLDVVIRGVDWFGRLNDKTDGFAGMITLVAGVVGGTVAALGSLVSILGASTTAVAAASGAVGALGTAFTLLTGPVGIAVAAIAGLAVAWRRNLFDIQGKTRAAFQVIRGVVDQAMTFIWEDRIKPLWNAIRQVWQTHAGGIRSETRETFNALMETIGPFVDWALGNLRTLWQVVRRLWDAHGSEIMAVTDAVFYGIVTTIQIALDLILTGFRVTMAALRGDWGEAWGYIAGFAERTWNRLISSASQMWDALLGLFKSGVGGVIDWFKNLARRLIGGSIIPAMLSDIISAVKSWSIADAFRGILSSAASAVRGKISAIVGSVKSALSRIRNLGSRISSAVSGARSQASGAVSGIPGLQSGGVIESGGLAQLHEGEVVVPAAQVDRDVGGSAKNLTINGGIVINTDSDDPEDMADDLLAKVNARF